MDYYNILGVDKTATQEEIKKAYRKLAHQYHPDKKGGDENKFKEINEAYQILSSKEKRSKYDTFGNNFEGARSAGGFDFNSFFQQGNDFNGIDLGDLFGDAFGFRGRKQESMNKGRNIEVEMEISLFDTLNETKKDISLAKLIECQRCEGSGAEPGTKLKECFSCRGTGTVQQMRKTILGTITRNIVCPECKGEGRIPEKPCNVCKGEGRIEGEETIAINIPKGVDTGQVIKVLGKGESGKRGEQSGDLYIRILVKPHPLFERRGDDLYTQVPITFSQSVLGGEVDIKMIDNKNFSLKVPQSTESGKVLRIQGKGIPHFSSFGRGNLFVELFIATPKKLTKEQKMLLKELRNQGL